MVAIDAVRRVAATAGEARWRHSASGRCAVAILGVIGAFAPQIGAQAASDEAPKPAEAVRAEDQAEQLYAEAVESFNDLMKEKRFEAAVVVGEEAQRLQPDNPTSESMIVKARHAAHSQMQRLDAHLAHQLASVDQICGLTAEQKERLRLAGRGDIKRFCDGANWRPIEALFSRGSMFTKVLRTTLTTEQMAAYQAAARVSPIGNVVVRWVDPLNKKVWIGVGEADGLQPRMLYGVRMKLQAEPDAGSPDRALGEERIKGTIEITRVLEEHLSEARILDEMVDSPISKGDLIIPVRHDAR
jgi:hypothetical protein